MKTNQELAVDTSIPMMRLDACVPILQEELSLLQQLALTQELVRQEVINREWKDFDGRIAELNELGNRFKDLESERIRLFALIAPACSEGEARFLAIISRMPLDRRPEFTRLYRELKLFILRIRISNESLTAYINEARVTMSSFLEAAFPERKGRFYTSRGTQALSDMRSMFVNQTF